MTRTGVATRVAAAVTCGIIALSASRADAQEVPFRPPAVPLVVHDPYFSIWSASDKLNDSWPVHWTGKTHALGSMARIDGKTYRIMGAEPKKFQAMEQKGVQVLPTRTIYQFEQDGVALRLTFLTPALPHNLDILSRPVTYVVWDARATDGKEHEVSVYLDASAELAVDSPAQEVAWSRLKAGDLSLLRVGTTKQDILNRPGDDLRIDWGYLYLAVPTNTSSDSVIGSHGNVRERFASTGRLPESDDTRMPRRANDHWPLLACSLDMGKVGEAEVSRRAMVAYDDLYSIEYLGRRCRPYWRRTGMDASELLRTAASDYERLKKECEEYDTQLLEDLTRTGGEKFAQVASLSFRQCLAAHKLVADFDGKPLYFSRRTSATAASPPSTSPTPPPPSSCCSTPSC